MRERLAIFNSDEVNSQGIVMPVSVLASALEQRWFLGTPMHRSHDRHRVDGWSRPLGLHLEPGLARLTGICGFPETQREADDLEAATRRHHALNLAEYVQPHLNALRERLGDALDGTEVPVHLEAAALQSKGLASRMFPRLFVQADKDGLILLRLLEPIAPGVFRHGELLLFASHFLRRSLSRLNTLNEPFLSRLQPLADNEGLTVKIRLDHDTVGLASTFQQPLEFAHWWGPRFDDDLQSIPIGLTRHQANEMQLFFSGIHHTEFWWHAQNGLKTIECEEVLDIPSLGVGSDVYGSRYVHSILDEQTDLPMHLDGAIRMYSEDAMIARLDENLIHAGRHSDYTKLWRVDGQIPIAVWKELICHHFRDNELVGEYLGGSDDQGLAIPEVIAPSASPMDRIAPCSMAAGDGVRVSVAYHLADDEDTGTAEVELISRDTWGSADNRQAYVEADSYEPVKLLRQQGVHVEVPKDALRLAFEDTVINMSLLMHRGLKAVENARRTMNVFRSLCDAWVNRSDDRNVSFIIGVEYEDRKIYFSFAGHVIDLQIVLNSLEKPIPASPHDVGEWAARIRNLLTGRFPASNDRPPIRRMMQRTGILQFDREMINTDWYRPVPDGNGDLAGYEFAIPQTQTDLIQLMKSNQMFYAPLHVIYSSTCTGCQNEYIDCDCSKYTNIDVGQSVTEYESVGLFWTNRPARRVSF
jgi:hypothetical protein